MNKAREKAIKLYWKIAKERCPFQNEEMVNSFLEGFIDCAEYLLLQNTELEEKISVLLSCKNCPENKGGLICQKEYENKCLAQKIQYIKELQEEIAELKKKAENLQKYLDTQNCYRECAETWLKLTEAKEIIKELNEGLDKLYLSGLSDKQIAFIEQLQDKAEQFLKGENIILEDAQAGNSPFDADEIFNKEMKAYPEEK